MSEAQLIFDDYGKPIIILRDQDQQNRLTGNDAIKVMVLHDIPLT